MLLDVQLLNTIDQLVHDRRVHVVAQDDIRIERPQFRDEVIEQSGLIRAQGHILPWLSDLVLEIERPALIAVDPSQCTEDLERVATLVSLPCMLSTF